MNTSTDSFGFLLADASRLMRRAFARLAVDQGITLAQARLLIYIHRTEGVRQVDLAEMLEVQPITLARLLDHLVNQGLAERRPAPHDRRAFQVYLTAAAQPVLEAIARIGERVRAQALQGLSDDEVASAMRVMQRVRTNLCARQVD